ncbi:MAG: Fic family protein [Ignavibacteria bacterium]|nr:Fic family protein [Ignavibacteria bacterium]
MLFPLEQKIRLDTEIITLLNSAESTINQLSGMLTLFNQNHFITKILQTREAIESLSIDDYGFSIKEFYTMVCMEDFKSVSIPQKLISASLLGQRLIKNVSRSQHIIKSIYKELIEDNDKEILRSKVIDKYNLPLPGEIYQLMERFEKYIESDVSYPPLINAALVHAQFEVIHPFEKMNGLIGRVLIQLHLQWKKRMVNNCLQVSSAINRNKQEYFSRLLELENTKDWNGWIKYFLTIIIDSANETSSIIKNLYRLENDGYEKIINSNSATPMLIKFYDYVFSQPIISIPHITKALRLTKQTANIVASRLVELDLVEEVTGKQRYRLYINKKLMDFLHP